MAVTVDTFLDAGLELIEEFGEPVLLRTSIKTVDPATHTVVETSIVTETPKCFLYEIEARYIDGDVIRVGDQYLLVSAKELTIVPVLNMTATAGGITYTALHVQVHRVFAQPVLYQVQLRR